MKKEIQQCLKGIVLNIILKAKDNIDSFGGIFGGDFGSLLLLFYYAKYSKEKKYIIVAENLLKRLLDNLDNQQHSYCNGLSGILYLFEFLKDEQFIEVDLSESIMVIDNYLLKKLDEDTNNKQNDFLHGSLGTSFYFLKIDRQKVTNKYIDFLYNSAKKNDNIQNTFSWTMGLEKYHSRTGSDISLSHGMASLIIFLVRTYEQEYNSYKIQKMISTGINFILNQEINPLKYGSYFPCFSLEKSEIPIRSRLAWCYGDLGVATALWYAGDIMKNEVWRRKAIDIFQYSTKRLLPSDTYVSDASICHGSAGIAMIFNRMYLNTGIPEFHVATNYWIKETLRLLEEKREPILNSDYSLLTGLSGIGLVLLSYISNDSQSWDELFLLSYKKK